MKCGQHQGPEVVLRTLFNSILNEVIVYIEQRFKTMGDFRFIGLLNSKHFHA